LQNSAGGYATLSQRHLVANNNTAINEIDNIVTQIDNLQYNLQYWKMCMWREER
jgi:hypothetical protein